MQQLTLKKTHKEISKMGIKLEISPKFSGGEADLQTYPPPYPLPQAVHFNKLIFTMYTCTYHYH